MKCLNCAQENKDSTRFCRKCGGDLTLAPGWFPGWKWHMKTLSWIYIALIAGFFSLSWLLHKLPPPYNQRRIPSEMTPWLSPHKTPAP